MLKLLRKAIIFLFLLCSINSFSMELQPNKQVVNPDAAPSASSIPAKHRCNICGHISPHNSKFIVHMRTHTGEKPFGCTFKGCNKSFAEAGTLRKHFRIHTGKKPFACNKCGVSFRQTSHLNYHKKTRHSNGNCLAPASSSACDEIDPYATESDTSDKENEDSNIESELMQDSSNQNHTTYSASSSTAQVVLNVEQVKQIIQVLEHQRFHHNKMILFANNGLSMNPYDLSNLQLLNSAKYSLNLVNLDLERYYSIISTIISAKIEN